MAAGRTLTGQSGGAARVALFGRGVRALADALAKLGVEVLLAEDPALAEYTGDGYVQAVRGLLESTKPRLLLVAHTAEGYDLAPAVAGALDLPLVTNAVGLRLDGDRLVVTRRLLNEKVQAEVEIGSDRTIVVTIRPGSVKAAGPAAGGTVIPTAVAVDATKARTRFVRIERPMVQDIDLAAADVIVSAGRGIQKKENLPLVEEFAKAVGGVVGASRPLTDMDWLPKTRQVGQSGKTVRPKLYVACGISGAMQHVAGMKDAGLIIAINTDPTAPIFEIAHIGFVADVLKLLPATIKELRA
ncbi:MAG: electron transfer flavoprotein subunit alpha/FixB family protein [Methanobacteriota archaeon]|nr:MAG: electron transfer flavoprotein subunit alpha/FixB family protein [Euryarchaeota archaeon]